MTFMNETGSKFMKFGSAASTNDAEKTTIRSCNHFRKRTEASELRLVIV